MSANGRYGLDLDASDSEDDDVMRLPGETISKTSPRPRSSSSDASDTTSNEPMPMRVSAEVAFLGEVDGAPSVHRSARKTPSKPALGHALANDLFDVGRFGLGDFFPTRDSRSPRHESGAAGVGPGADALAAAAALRRELAASTNTAQRRVDRKRRVPPASTAFAIAQSVLRDLEQKKPLQFREIKRDPTRVTDAHSMFGSSFRASWGPNGQLVHPGRLCASTVASVGGFQACANAQTQKGSPHAPHAKVTTERFAPGVGGGCVAARVAALEVALQVTVAYASGRDAMDSGDALDRGDTLDSGDPDSDAPNGWCSATFGKRLRASCSRVDLPGVCDAYLNSVENVALVSNKTPSSDLKLEVSAWDLVKTLWGDAPGAAPVASAADRHRRRASVSEWLRKQTASRGDAVSGVTSPKLLVPEKTATGALVSATRLACSNGDPRLATLIAQSARGGALPELAGAQLKIWRDSVVEKYVPSETTLLFEVIAGEVAPFRSDLPVKDWRTNFGLHLWYGTSPSTTVGKVMDGYLRSVETESATYPSAPGSLDVDEKTSRLKDVCFNLLALAQVSSDELRDEARSDTMLRQMFHPLTYVADDLTNVALAWHLFNTLVAVGAVPETQSTSRLHDELTVNFATQLDSFTGVNSVPEWQVFVLMHLSDGPRRADATRRVLHKRCADWANDDGKKNFMTEKAGVPKPWLDAAELRWRRNCAD